jgi:hypothetical protein
MLFIYSFGGGGFALWKAGFLLEVCDVHNRNMFPPWPSLFQVPATKVPVCLEASFFSH